MIPAEPVTIPARDGYALAAEHLAPEDRPPRAAVVIASATGVPRRLYAAFAAYLAEAGFAVLTFDYRGIGGSRPERLRGFRAAMHDWGELDLAGVIDWTSARHPALPLLVVGHSVGGQLVGFAPNADRVTALLTVAAQSGYWGHWSGRDRLWLLANWYLVMPVLTTLCGYMPMRRLGQGEDLPAEVAREWARWGRHPDHLLIHARARGLDGHRRFAAPIRAYALADDDYAPPRAVGALLEFYASAPRELRVVAPADLGLSELGHFAVFKERFRDSLWREWREWLLAQTADAFNPTHNGMAPCRGPSR